MANQTTNETGYSKKLVTALIVVMAGLSIMVITLVVLFALMLPKRVKKEDYDTLQRQLDKKQVDLSVAETQVSVVEAERDDYKEKYESVSEEYTSYKNEIEQAEMEKLEEERRQQEELADRMLNIPEDAEIRTDISYDDLIRTPDEYEGQYVQFSGEVAQLIEGNDEVDMRIAINSNYDKMMFISYLPSISSERLVEDDIVTFKGMYVGIYQYESTLGGLISVPAVWVGEISRK